MDFVHRLGDYGAQKSPGCEKVSSREGGNTIVGTLEVAVLTITLDVLADRTGWAVMQKQRRVVMKAARDGG
jgi:hypothetical protein